MSMLRSKELACHSLPSFVDLRLFMNLQCGFVRKVARTWGAIVLPEPLLKNYKVHWKHFSSSIGHGWSQRGIWFFYNLPRKIIISLEGHFSASRFFFFQVILNLVYISSPTSRAVWLLIAFILCCSRASVTRSAHDLDWYDTKGFFKLSTLPGNWPLATSHYVVNHWATWMRQITTSNMLILNLFLSRAKIGNDSQAHFTHLTQVSVLTTAPRCTFTEAFECSSVLFLVGLTFFPICRVAVVG